MKSTVLWVADACEMYANAFMEYVNLKKGQLFQVRGCTDEEQLVKALAGEEIEILLITAEWYERYRELIHISCVIILSEGSLMKEFSSQPVVYKYQSAENILREIMYYYSGQDTEGTYITGVGKENRLIGVYSPVGGIGKAVFALTLGQILAESRNLLYLNLEENSGMAEFMGSGHWNMSDPIYFLIQKNNTQFLYRLNSMVQKLDRMDYIPPCDSYTDFRQIELEEWNYLLRLIRTRSSYDVIILDLGNAMGHEPELLQQCDGIYMPVRQDMISRAKISQWERYISDLDNLQVLEKLQKLELPQLEHMPDSEEDLLALPRQKLGAYIRGLIRE